MICWGCCSRNWITPSCGIKENFVFLWEALKGLGLWPPSEPSSYVTSSHFCNYCIVTVALKKKSTKQYKEFSGRIMNLSDNIFFQVSLIGTIIAFSTLFPPFCIFVSFIRYTVSLVQRMNNVILYVFPWKRPKNFKAGLSPKSHRWHPRRPGRLWKCTEKPQRNTSVHLWQPG